MAEQETVRCPTCGEGTLVDVSFDLDASDDADGSQDAESRQLETYSCGHTVVGPRLSSADQDGLTVERRTSDETVIPIEDDRSDTLDG
jgi:formylmethanofuran dehydrogenase subunit E